MNKLELLEIAAINNDYNNFISFLESYNNVTIPEFDYYLINKLSLFMVHENFSFDDLDQMISKINYVLPSIKRIFARPIIHLKDTDEVLPVEAVRLINNKTINHIATHSELWDDITSTSIKPLKLMTRVYNDDFCIYENMVFAKTIDTILNYLKKQMKIIREMLYSGKILEMNLLESVNHPNYFLAIGKLHTGYIRSFSQNYETIKEYYNKLNYYKDVITSRLKRNVYHLNKNYPNNFSLHNSNILLMQKDYHRVYNLLKHFRKIKADFKPLNETDFLNFKANYYIYVKFLMVFAITNFNFEAQNDTIIDFNNLNLIFEFKKWQIELKTVDGDILLKIKQEKEYSILISILNDKTGKYDEILPAYPIEVETKHILLSIDDIDSFRRIEQIILRGMIYTTNSFDLCPFCGEKMSFDEKKGEFICFHCRQKIVKKYCDIKKENYFETSIDSFVPKELIKKDAFYHYRNITNYNSKAEFICPYCNKVH